MICETIIGQVGLLLAAAVAALCPQIQSNGCVTLNSDGESPRPGQSLVQSLAWVRPITHQFCRGWMSQEYRIQSNLDMPYIHRWRTKAFERSQNDHWTAQRPIINLAIFSQKEKATHECKMPQKNTEISSALMKSRMALKHLSGENF